MRWATLVLLTLLGCNDLRDFRGAWSGARVGDAAPLRVGRGGTATLAIDGIDAHGLSARLAIDGLLPEAAFTSIEGAEADVLANLTFSGAPLRVYLGFVAIPDGGGEAMVIVALYDDRRVEVRVLRGGIEPLYAIFALTES
ncbi:MAG TPA: hypothetical protein VK427_01580 [Kofleriaceae bacterium]|nr:hypothetical protein [Kofleriaceae bacterium]